MALCRTCETTSAEELYLLKSANTVKYPGKQLLDLLTELIEINQNMAYESQLPQHICGNCKEKLNIAYDFMLQAREANQRLLDGLKPDVKLSTDECCLQELPMEQFVAVKLEPGGDESTPIEFAETLMEQHESDLDADEDDDDDVQRECDMLDEALRESSADDEEEIYDPLTPMKQRRSKTLTKEKDDVIDNDINEDNDDNYSSSDDDAPLLKRKLKMQKAKIKQQKEEKPYTCEECGKSFRLERTLKTHKHKHTRTPKSKEMHHCPQCTRKFSRPETLQQHLKTAHTTSPDGGGGNTTQQKGATLSARKLAKELDLNLCKPHGCKVIQCMICMQHYTKISELRNHLNAHPEIDTFSRRTETLQEIAESFYPDIKEEITEAALLERIHKDLKAKKFVYFYSITNQAGYELRLESSDSDSDEDGDIRPKKHFYACDLCTNTKYNRKYLLFEHQLEKHTWEDAQHVCRRCDAHFLSKQVLQHHYESQCRNSQKRFLCNRCPLRFRWRHNLKSHYRDHRTKPTSLVCEHCDRSYDDKKSLTIHKLTVHTASTLMPCLWCNRKFYRRDYFVKHLKRHGLKEHDLPLAETLIKATAQPNGAKRIVCKICQLQFERIADLRAHILMELKLNLSAHQSYESWANYSITNEEGFELHLDDSETDNDESGTTTLANMFYKCEICQVQCRRRYEMFQHQRAMHCRDPMPHQCDKCIFKCVTKRILEHHQQTQCQNPLKQLNCEHCNYKFMWPENLEQHRQMQHANANAETKLNIGALMSTVSGESPEKATQPDTKPSTAALLNCPHCDRTYMHQSWLRNHIRDVHSEAGKKKKKESERKFLCSLCGKEASSAAALVTHMRRHTGERPFKCDMCEMGFPRHSEMLQHRRKHTGEKPYHCTVCGKDFARSDKLKRHTLIHSGLKPYKCTYCEKSYRQTKDLKLHLQQHTGETPFECSTCGERFIQRVAMEKHRIMRGHFEEIQ